MEQCNEINKLASKAINKRASRAIMSRLMI